MVFPRRICIPLVLLPLATVWVEAARVKRGRLVKGYGKQNHSRGAASEKVQVPPPPPPLSTPPPLFNEGTADSRSEAEKAFATKIEQRRSEEFRWARTLDALAAWKKKKRHKESGAPHAGEVDASTSAGSAHLHERQLRRSQWTSVLNNAMKQKRSTSSADEAEKIASSGQPDIRACLSIKCKLEEATVVVGKDETGCPIEKCEPRQIMHTGEHHCRLLMCEAGEEAIVLGTDSYGCSIEKCVPMSIVSPDHPDIHAGEQRGRDSIGQPGIDLGDPDEEQEWECMSIMCVLGETLVVLGKDSRGCPIEKCEAKKIASSDQPDIRVSEQGGHPCLTIKCKPDEETVVVGKDGIGCPIEKCEPRQIMHTGEHHCQVLMCEVGEEAMVLGKDSHGCSIEKCVPTSIASPEHPDIHAGEKRGHDSIGQPGIDLGVPDEEQERDKSPRTAWLKEQADNIRDVQEAHDAAGKEPKFLCPEIYCASGKKVGIGTDELGCPIERCVKEKEVHKRVIWDCQTIDCGENGKIKKIGKDAHGCPIEECEVDCSFGCVHLLCEEGKVQSCHGEDKCGCSICECHEK